jgi:hypothetical protein
MLQHFVLGFFTRCLGYRGTGKTTAHAGKILGSDEILGNKISQYCATGLGKDAIGIGCIESATCRRE